jgi:hypothetical protein
MYIKKYHTICLEHKIEIALITYGVKALILLLSVILPGTVVGTPGTVG